MEWVAIVTTVALIQCTLFSFVVGRARVKYQIRAPAVQGHEVFERTLRIHANTVEQLILFLPALWLFAWYLEPRAAAVLGGAFILARQRYFNDYLEQPRERGTGFLAGLLVTLTLLVGGLAGAVYHLYLST